MKKIFYSLILITGLIHSVVNAQQVNFKWGPSQISEGGVSSNGDLLGYDAESYYLSGAVKHGWWIFGTTNPLISSYNFNHKLLSQKEFSYKKDKITLKPNGSINTKNKVCVFATHFDKKAEKNFLYYKSFDNQLNTDDDWVELDDIPATKSSNSGAFSVLMSDDKGKIFIYHSNPYDKKTKNESFAFKVFDADFKLQWEKNVEMNYKDKEFSIQNYSISNSGKIVMMARKDLNKNEKEKGKPKYKFIVLIYDQTKDRIEEYEVALGTKYITDITYSIDDKNDKLIIAGFYSNKGPGYLTGAFYQRIDIETKKLESENTKEFDHDMLAQHMTEKKMDKGNELFNYDIRQMIKREDGGTVLVAEQYWVQVVTTTTRSGNTTYTTTTYYYHYNDIIVINIDPDGKIGWATTIPKTSVTTNDGGYYLSYSLIVKDNKMYFLYYDNEDNYKRITNTTKKNSKLFIDVKAMPNVDKAVLALTTIDSEGEMTREIYQKSYKERDAKKEPIFIPKRNYYMDDKTLVYSSRGKDYRYGFITIDQSDKNDKKNRKK